MANSSKYAEVTEIADQSPARLNISTKPRNRSTECVIPRINNPGTHSQEQIADGVREIDFTKPLLGPEPIRKSVLPGVAERGGERQ